MSTIVTRTGKGSALTHAEADDNFTNLNTDKLEAADIGVSVQAYSANLTEYAAVTPTVAGLALLDDADASAQRTTLGLGTAATTASSAYAVAAKGVTNGDSHDHSGGDGAQIAYSGLSGLPTLGTMAAEAASTYAKKSADADVDMNNYKISEIKTASFNTEVSASGTSGAVTCAFANGQKMKVVPTGAVTSFALSFPGVGHYQLRIDMGTSYAITWTFSGVTAYQIDAAAPTTAASKSTFVNFF